MTQEEKQLLLIDLCGRLPYEVKVKFYSMEYPYGSEPMILTIRLLKDMWENIHDVKPYLRPMSSMTDEEVNEFILISDTVLWLGEKRPTCILSLEQMDWLNKNMFDYRGLIPMGLALEAPEGMYKIE